MRRGGSADAAVVVDYHGDRAGGAIRRRLHVDLRGADVFHKGRLAIDRDADSIERRGQVAVHDFGRGPGAAGVRISQVGALNGHPGPGFNTRLVTGAVEHGSNCRRTRPRQFHHKRIAVAEGRLHPSGNREIAGPGLAREDHIALGIHRGRQRAIVLRSAEIRRVVYLAAVRRNRRHEGVRQSGAGGLRRHRHREIDGAGSTGHRRVSSRVERDGRDPILHREDTGFGGVEDGRLHGGVAAQVCGVFDTRPIRAELGNKAACRYLVCGGVERAGRSGRNDAGDPGAGRFETGRRDEGPNGRPRLGVVVRNEYAAGGNRIQRSSGVHRQDAAIRVRTRRRSGRRPGDASIHAAHAVTVVHRRRVGGTVHGQVVRRR